MRTLKLISDAALVSSRRYHAYQIIGQQHAPTPPAPVPQPYGFSVPALFSWLLLRFLDPTSISIVNSKSSATPFAL